MPNPELVTISEGPSDKSAPDHQAALGLSFGLIHSRPLPFTGVRVFMFAQATDDGKRW